MNIHLPQTTLFLEKKKIFLVVFFSITLFGDWFLLFWLRKKNTKLCDDMSNIRCWRCCVGFPQPALVLVFLSWKKLDLLRRPNPESTNMKRLNQSLQLLPLVPNSPCTYYIGKVLAS